MIRVMLTQNQQTIKCNKKVFVCLSMSTWDTMWSKKKKKKEQNTDAALFIVDGVSGHFDMTSFAELGTVDTFWIFPLGIPSGSCWFFLSFSYQIASFSQILLKKIINRDEWTVRTKGFSSSLFVFLSFQMTRLLLLNQGAKLVYILFIEKYFLDIIFLFSWGRICSILAKMSK